MWFNWRLSDWLHNDNGDGVPFGSSLNLGSLVWIWLWKDIACSVGFDLALPFRSFPTEVNWTRHYKEPSHKMRSFQKSTLTCSVCLSFRRYIKYKNQQKSLKENKRNQKLPNFSEFLESQKTWETIKNTRYKRLLIIHQGMLHNKLANFIVPKEIIWKKWSLMAVCIFWDKFCGFLFSK